MIIRNITPPPGSTIWVTQDSTEHVIRIPQSGASSTRYLVGAFLLFWLGGWFIGLTSAGSQVMSGKGGAFVIVWLGGWTVGGVLAMMMLYRIFRPAVSEALKLGADGLGYDSGIPPFRYEFGDSNQRPSWSSYFPKRTVVTINRRDLRSLRLRETMSGNRLTVDVASARIELARGASEVEREWLYRLLTERYALPSPATSR